MTDEWKQISDFYHAALKLPENERAAFLQSSVASDGVRREVASLLANERTGEHLLDSPALEVAARMMNDNGPVLTVGQTLAHYQITSRLGKGGMGEVYRARDGKLGRDVAIKTLPPEFARDPDRVARFHREAKLLASLNHPNIAAIYGLEESDRTNFLVLELAEGETLADRIKAGPISIEESLKLALQIAEALEAAHEKGIIHRDLKPANIKVTPDGKVKVLDFGLAKAFAGEQAEVNLTNSPTLSNAATQQGVILGTAAYMSPEQARGKAVDKRADIWAFGCVLFEMLTGRAAFAGDDVSDILASVIRSEPDWSKLPSNLHWRIRELLERCLEKEARNRYSGISDARVDIQKVQADPGGVLAQRPIAAAPERHLRPGLRWTVAAVILAIIITGAAIWKFKPAEPREVARFEYNLPDDQQFSNLGFEALAVSRDGRQFAYSTPKGLYLRSLDEVDAKLIAGTEGSVQQPFFSPDGKWLGYLSLAEQKLKKIPVNGGTPSSLCDIPQRIWGAWWNEDDTILYGMQGVGIMRISAAGGNPECIVKHKTGSLVVPQILPDGKSLMYTSLPMPQEKIVVRSLKSGESKELFKGMWARYLSTGHIVYRLSDNSNLYARPFNLDRLEATGEPVPVVEGLSKYDISDSGTLVYIPGSGSLGQISASRTLVWVNREGKEEPSSAPSENYSYFRISPDGKRVALTVSKDLNKSNIYIWDIASGILTRLTLGEGASSSAPLWTLDGKQLVYTSRGENQLTSDLYWRAADGTGEVEKLASVSSIQDVTRVFTASSWSGDGKDLVLSQQMNPFQVDIGTLSMEKNHARKLLFQYRNFSLSQPRVSPDGRWIAYVSGESGKSEVFVRPYPDVNTGGWQVSTNGGHSPLWSLPDGRELFYRNGDATMVVPVETGPTFKPGKPTVLFRGAYFDLPGNDFIFWDISPDGKRFLMLKGGAIEAPRKMNVVLNWFEDLKRLVPKK